MIQIFGTPDLVCTSALFLTSLAPPNSVPPALSQVPPPICPMGSKVLYISEEGRSPRKAVVVAWDPKWYPMSYILRVGTRGEEVYATEEQLMLRASSDTRVDPSLKTTPSKSQHRGQHWSEEPHPPFRPPKIEDGKESVGIVGNRHEKYRGAGGGSSLYSYPMPNNTISHNPTPTYPPSLTNPTYTFSATPSARDPSGFSQVGGSLRLTSLLPGNERIPQVESPSLGRRMAQRKIVVEVGQTLQECVHTAWKKSSSFKG